MEHRRHTLERCVVEADELVLERVARKAQVHEELLHGDAVADNRALLRRRKLEVVAAGDEPRLRGRGNSRAGVGFVTVQNSGWDMHADGNNPGIGPGMDMLGPPLDKAVSAFLDDLTDRNLLDKVLLVITGDFGRTPTINARGGRDHYPALCTLAFAGGGLAKGQIIGQSTPKNDAPAGDPITLVNLHSTLLHAQFDIGQLRLDTAPPRDLTRLAEPPPISGLF